MSKIKIVVVAMVWLVLLAIGVTAWRYWLQPQITSQQEQEKQQQNQQAIDRTSGQSRYREEVVISLDSFSGYAVLRSARFSELLKEKGIRLTIKDDAADYNARLKDLASGNTHLAAFPLDALIKSSQQLGQLPATIVAIIDETKGADAMVGCKSRYPTVDALNNDQTKFVLVGDSPSETLVRVVMHDFGLKNLADSSIDRVTEPDAIMKRYRGATPAGNEVFVAWEPQVSQLLANPEMHVLVDSSRFSGYIVDGLAVSRDFLLKKEPLVREILEAYFTAFYDYQEPERMQKLIVEDAKANGTTLDDNQAARLTKGIAWKNTQENLAHFGIRTDTRLTHIEDMLGRIERVLLATGGISADPTDGQLNRLFFDRPLLAMHESNFHPGINPEEVRAGTELPPLSDEQWRQLVPVGTLNVPPLVFHRGSANLTEHSQALLDDVVETLHTWPQYYLQVRGNASNKGSNLEANRQLAAQRARAALEYLLSKGVGESRLKAVDGVLSGETSVQFIVGQTPY